MSQAVAPSLKRKRSHRACDYCRVHRIRCVYEGSEICKHCTDYNIVCEKVAPPPRDVRPRTRFMHRFVDQPLDDQQGIEPGYLGGTSIAQLAWSFCPTTARGRLQALDFEQDLYRGAICDDELQGLLIGRQHVASRRRGPHLAFSQASSHLAQRVGAEGVLYALYETASARIITVFPVISKHESLLDDMPDDSYWDRYTQHHYNSTPPTTLPAIVRIIHYALAAMSRTVPGTIRNNVLEMLRSLIVGDEYQRMCQTASLSTVQVLVLLSMCDELFEQGDSTAWQTLGTGLRMAQDLALHRSVSLDHVPLGQRNRRSRVWGACLCADRWSSIRNGQMLSIDLKMCDAPLPQATGDHTREAAAAHATPSFRFLLELTKISILIGRAYRMTCTPAGLRYADDASLLILETDIDMWLAQVPTTWPYTPKFDTPAASDLVNIFSVVLDFTFIRPFIWAHSAHDIPLHVQYRPTDDRWINLVARAKQAVVWAESELGAFYLDVWSNVVYSLFCCMLVLFKHHEDDHSLDSGVMFERADDVIQAWAASSSETASRQRIASSTALLRSTLASTRSRSPQLPENDPLTPGAYVTVDWLADVGGPEYELFL